MIIDLVHNKIIADTISERFAESVEYGLVSLLAEKYGDRLLGIQMYEDHLADGFMRDGEWYYPLTAVTTDGPETCWVKWRVDASFDDGVPYSYMGEEPIAFSLAAAVPVEFLNKMEGRAIYYEGGYITVRVQSASQKPTFLAGKYSQSFVDEMARQLTAEISSAMLVEGLEDSRIELHLVFAPATYMEHTSENVTYRRLLLVGKTGTAKDFWIKWTRPGSDKAWTVSDHVSGDDIVFAIGEDASHKIREKEYRFLLARSGDKYRNALGRKNVTDWRETIKRAAKRGELLKLDPPVEDEPEIVEAPTMETAASATDDVNDRLAAVLGVLGDKSEVAPVEDKPEDEEFARAMRACREAVGAVEDISVDKPEEADDAELDEITKLAREALALANEKPAEVRFGDEDEAEATEEADDSVDEADAIPEDPTADEFSEGADFTEMDEELYEDSEAIADARALEPDDEPEIKTENATAPKVGSKEYEEKLRAELETKIRLEYESLARQRAEEEAARLRREQEQLKAENERLQELARREREAKAEREAARLAEEAKLRAQIEAQVRAEVREKERLAEAARNAVAEQRRLEEERAERERKRIEEERRLEEERRRAEEAARLEAERQREAERIRREQAGKTGSGNAAPTPDASVNYISKSVKLIFRRNVDPNITGRIHEIIKATVDYYKKADVYIRIKASVPDSTTVVLDFLKIPEEEMELLKNIIKVLGNSGLGIAKAIVE